jgi:hypothetical protein
MKTIPLNQHPRWRIYRALRKAVKLELEASIFTRYVDRPDIRSLEGAVDDFIREEFLNICGDLKMLLSQDRAQRAARDLRPRTGATRP